MANAKAELVHIMKIFNKNIEDVEFILISKSESLERVIINKDNPTEEDLELLNFEYDKGYGSQKLFGFVLFNDYTWLQRGEYDGSEWWDYMEVPTKEKILSLFDY